MIMKRKVCKIDTPKEKLSNDFWQSYEYIIHHKTDPQRGGLGGGQSKEQNAHNRLKSLLQEHKRRQIQLTSEQIAFVKHLLKDIREYKTLPDYDLRTLGVEDSNDLINNIKYLREKFGDNYLQPIIDREQQMDNDVVIAVENIL